MADKKTMDDMIPPEKRTIRRVPLGTTARPRQNTSAQQETLTENHSIPEVPLSNKIPPRSPMWNRGSKTKKRKWFSVGLLIVALLLLVFVFLSVFSRATLTVMLRTEQTAVDGTFVAGTAEAFDVLPYEIFTVTRSDQERVAATGEKYVEAKASGSIVIFNDFDENEQRLIESTRFQTPGGLVYRVQEPVTVPGQSTNGDGEVIPGSIEVRVVADEPGSEYNISGLRSFINHCYLPSSS